MKNTVKFMVIIFLTASSFFTSELFAAESQFEIRADGLACPYCAYGIEKKLMQIDGVKHLDINLKKGLVIVTGEQNLTLKPSQLKTLFNDSGFTFRTLKKIDTTQPIDNGKQ